MKFLKDWLCGVIFLIVIPYLCICWVGYLFIYFIRLSSLGESEWLSLYMNYGPFTYTYEEIIRLSTLPFYHVDIMIVGVIPIISILGLAAIIILPVVMWRECKGNQQ